MPVSGGVVRQSLTHLKVPRSHKPMMRRFGTTPWERHCVFAYKSVCFEDVFHDWSGCIFEARRWDARLGVYSPTGTPDVLISTLRVYLVLKFGLSWAWWWISLWTNMTSTRRRVRVSKYIAQVNHMGTDMGTKFMLLYFIYIKQLLKASKWRCYQTKPNPSQSATIIQTYKAQIWNHSMRVFARFCL